ncbi:hypothetical protein L6232_24285, partial [Shewanella sp. C31]|nr:hypothetical protein [Shewanella electrica]
ARGLAFALRVASAPADRTWPVPVERRVFKVLNDETARGAEHFMSSAFNLDARGLYVVKDPEAALDYSLDWSEWVGDGDALATSEFTVA